MEIDTKNGASDTSSDSSDRRSDLNSEPSTRKSKPNSQNDPGKEDGQGLDKTPKSLSFVLSLLEANIGELRTLGAKVRMFRHPEGLAILLPETGLCQTHKMIHPGKTCPLC